MEEVEYAYRSATVTLSKAAVERLARMGVAVDERYLDSVYEKRSPLRDDQLSILVWQDISNRELHSPDGLGRVVAYLADGPRFYDSLNDAIVDNWDERPEMGFERLHDKSILPTVQRVERFGVSMQVHNKDVRLRALNDLSKTIYRYKGGVTWRRIYEKNAGKPGVQDLPFDVFLRRMVLFFSHSLGDAVIGAIQHEREVNGAAVSREECSYRAALTRLLARYSTGNGATTAFEEVSDINDYDGKSGVYVFGLDRERLYYVGMASKSVCSRVLDHFRRPRSLFDRTHTLLDISSIHVLPIEDVWFGTIDNVEADCIATLGVEHVCNVEAASPAWFERKALMLRNYEKLGADFSAEELIGSLVFPVSVSGLRSPAYEPSFFQMLEDEVRRVAQSAGDAAKATGAKENARPTRRHTGRRPVVRMDDNMQIIERYDSVAEASRIVGVSTKSIRCAATGVQQHAAGYIWRYADETD